MRASVQGQPIMRPKTCPRGGGTGARERPRGCPKRPKRRPIEHARALICAGDQGRSIQQQLTTKTKAGLSINRPGEKPMMTPV